MNAFTKLLNLFRPPQQRQTSAVGLNEPAFAANNMTVERLAQILRQAEAGDVEPLFSVYRDIIGGHAHLQTEVNTRKLAVLGDPLSFAPRDKTNPADVRAAKAAERLKECPSWTDGRNHLLNGCLYPLALVEKRFKYAAPNDLGLRYDLAELINVPYHHLDFTDRGILRLHQYDEQTGMRLGGHFDPDPSRYIIHRGHLLTMLPDNWGGPLRAALFWWLFSVMDRDWWVRFLSRFGSPFIVGKYNTANPKDRGTLARAFSAASQLFALVVSKETEIAVHDVATSTHGDAFEKMHAVANRELSKLVLGQTMTSEAQAQGLGGSQAQVHNQVRGDIKQWDATKLSSTLEAQLVTQFLAINGLSGRVKIVTGSASPEEIKSAAETIKSAHESGLELTEQGIEQFSELAAMPFRRMATPQIPRDALAPLSRLHRPLFAEALAARTLPALPPGLSLPTEAELNAIASAGADNLAEAFTGLYAPLRRLILTSTSPEALTASLSQWYADLAPDHVAELTEQALTAYLANGSGSARRP